MSSSCQRADRKTNKRWLTILISTLLPCSLAAQSANVDEEIRSLRERIQLLEEQSQRSASPQESYDTAESGQSSAPVEQPPVKIGGALRFTYYLTDYDDDVKETRGRIGLDIFRINAKGKLGNLDLNAEYRFYPYMDTIHHGWVGYSMGEGQQIQAGITQVPFGLLPYASHNFWFGVPFYVGLADDYDLGVKYLHSRGSWDMQLAFFKNEELGSAADLERYSFDPVTTGEARNSEHNTFNLRGVYTTGKGSLCSHEMGMSGQYGSLRNADTGQDGSQWAVAGHLDSRCGRWNFQLQYARYGYDTRNPVGVSGDTVTLGAYAASYDIASYGDVAVANVAYNVPVNWPGIDLLTCYNDYSVLNKDRGEFDDSYINTTGCLISSGATFTYIDVIRAKNMAFLGGSLADGGSDEWQTRLNINFGIYW